MDLFDCNSSDHESVSRYGMDGDEVVINITARLNNYCNKQRQAIGIENDLLYRFLTLLPLLFLRPRYRPPFPSQFLQLN
jgi:hypothetical protein